MTPAGFPHSGIHGSLPAFGFPWLFVDRYALLRLPVPRHPPCALFSLTCPSTFLKVGVFQSRSNHFWVLLAMYVPCSIIRTSHILLKRPSRAGTSSFLFFASHTFVSLFSFQGTLLAEGNSRFALYLSYSASAAYRLPVFGFHRWWAQMDSNHRPHAYQACALTT